jgi:NAD(P)-dependent dehydrogenase (short-subunit alcohol dehydrogenase family)
VDILVNNLGPYSDVPFLELPEEQWDWVMSTNLKATYVLTQEFGPGMIDRQWGRIINISAASAFTYTHSIYSLSKAALLHLTGVLALELAPHVTVNAIAPGQIEDSELIDEIDPNYKRILREQSPLKQLVTRQQIADVILALCGETFATTTGHTFRMDAGWSIRSNSPNVGAIEYEDEE